MINDKTVLAVIPARGGSKGLPGKNLMRVGGRSLIGNAVAAARGCALVDRVIVSTDAAAIAAEAKACGAEVPFLRPPHLATDEATTAAVVEHVLDATGVEDGYLVLLQPTSPLRSSDDVAACLDLCRERGAAGVVSVVAVEASPYWMYRLDAGGQLVPVLAADTRPTRRQDAPATYTLNGAVYVVDIGTFRSTRAFVPEGTLGHVMPEARSIDIDTAADLAEARRIVQARDVGVPKDAAALGTRRWSPLPAAQATGSVPAQALRGRYAGRRVVIAGNGASLDEENLAGVERVVSIAVDQALLHCAARGLRPDAVMVTKDAMADDSGRVIAAIGDWCVRNGSDVIATDDIIAAGHAPRGAVALSALVRDSGVSLSDISGAGSLAAAILAAIALGATGIAMSGADFGAVSDWRAADWNEQARDLDRMAAEFKAYEALAALADSRGARVVNVTTDSDLAVFDRVRLAAFLDGAGT